MMRFLKHGETQKEFGSGLMKFSELREYLQVGRTTLYKMIKERQIPCYFIAGEYRFKKQEIDEWLKTRRIEAVSYI